MTLPLWKLLLIWPLAFLILFLETIEWGCNRSADWLADRVERVVGR